MNHAVRMSIIHLLSGCQSLIARCIRLLSTPDPPASAAVTVRIRYTIDGSSPSHYEGNNVMSRITTDQRVLVSLVALTAAGAAAPIDGSVAWASSDPEVATITPNGPFEAQIVPGTKTGATQITATFDADLGEGVRTITASGALEVVQAEAVVGTLTFGEPFIPQVDQ